MEYQKPRPPVTRWEVRPIEDRDASIADGIIRYKDVLFVTLIPAGGRDDVSYPADEWIANLREKMKRQNTLGIQPSDPLYFPPEWFSLFEKQYESAKSGIEVPISGTPINMCMFLSPSEQKACQEAHVKTLEDLAEANEQVISRLGWIGRQIKEKAISALRTQEAGKGALQFDSIMVKLKQLEEQVAAKDAEVATLQSMLTDKESSSKKRVA